MYIYIYYIDLQYVCELICMEKSLCCAVYCYCKVKLAISETALVLKKNKWKKKKKRMVPFNWLVLANKQQKCGSENSNTEEIIL